MDTAIYLRLLVDHAPSMLAYWDSGLRCRFANRAYERWFGVDPDALIGTSIRDLLGADLFALNEPYIRAALAGAEQTFERIVPGPDGVQRHSLAHYRPDIVDGEVRGFMVQVTEITRLKETEAALRASQAFLDRTGRIAGVGGWELDLRTEVTTWSAETRRIHEVSADYVPTVSDGIAFYAPEARPVIEAAVHRAMAHGTPWDLELPFVTARGRPLWVRAFGEVDYEDGVPVRLIGAFQDITEHRQRQADLQRENALRLESERHARDLDELLRERGQMLDVLAHEVRQPLNNASAALQSAAGVLTQVGEGVASLRLVRAQTVLSQVLASIDNTLAVASLLARPGPIQRADTDIDMLVAVTLADLPADERARVDCVRATSTRNASMDMSLMRLALRNVLTNALRYSAPESPVVVHLSDSDEPLAMVIEVRDTGPGIPAELRPRLFERGARQRVSGSSAPGMGLGLYIVRRVMELHGGLAEVVVGEAGIGTTVRLVITQPDV